MTEDITGVEEKLSQLLILELDQKITDKETKIEAIRIHLPDSTKKDKTRILYSLGFENKLIAQIIDSSEGSVRKYMSELREEGEI